MRRPVRKGTFGNDQMAFKWIVGSDIYTYAGDDIVALNGRGNNLWLGAGHDTLTLMGNRNTVYAGLGNDTIKATSGIFESTINLEDGNDTINFNGHGNRINAGTGDDAIGIRQWASANNVSAGAGRDGIWIWGKQNTIDAGDGNDYVLTQSSSRSNNIQLGNGDDVVELRGKADTVNGGFGRDNVHVFSDRNVLRMIDGNVDGVNIHNGVQNVIHVDGQDTVVFYGSGINRVEGFEGRVKIIGNENVVEVKGSYIIVENITASASSIPNAVIFDGSSYSHRAVANGSQFGGFHVTMKGSGHLHIQFPNINFHEVNLIDGSVLFKRDSPAIDEYAVLAVLSFTDRASQTFYASSLGLFDL